MSDIKIGFVFTNYNGSLFTRDAVRSISLRRESDDCRVVIVDNNSEPEEVRRLNEIKSDYPGIHLIMKRDNLGYFKGLNLGIQYLKQQDDAIKYIVVGNNDLTFPPDFIDTIKLNAGKIDDYAVISPNIITMDGVHQNPHVVSKIGKRRELMYDLYYMNYLFALVIKKIAMLTRRFTGRNDEAAFEVARTIYQGYGACYILGPLFFLYFNELWAPTFLMGEEFFLSKQLASKNLKIYYEPSIVVRHHSHASTDKLPARTFWEIARKAHRVYREHVSIWR